MAEQTGSTSNNLPARFRRILDEQDLPADMRDKLLEELSMLFEAINQVDEKLRIQNEQLVVARQQTEKQRLRYQALFDFAPDAFLVTDLNGVIQEANQAASAMFKVRKEHLLGKLMNLYIERAEWAKFAALLQSTQRVDDVEIRVQPRKGEAVTVSVTQARMVGGDLAADGFYWILHDVTRRKQMEVEINEMHRLLQESGEVERMLLAREIHDGPMQDLYGMVFRLNIYQGMTDNEELRNGLKDLEISIKSVAGNLRSTCGELRPPTINNLGLERAIRSHAEKVQEQHPELRIELYLRSDLNRLSINLRLALFRDYQQCMSNILRHAQASHVRIEFELDDVQVRLLVRDDGVGFNVPEKWVDLLRQAQYGLAGMAERAQLFDGTFEVVSSPGHGTSVQTIVPIV